MNRIQRVCVLLAETGVVTVALTAMAVCVDYGTWLWYMTKGGNRIAWLVPLAVALGFWLAFRETRPSIKRFSIGFHILYVTLVLAVLIVYWMEPFPD
jgi:hypothetical protein